MVINIFILFLVAFIPGFYIIQKPAFNNKNLHGWLVFAGSYIFSITIVHLIPELFTSGVSAQKVSIFILIGFFMQIFIDFLTSGVEHGHAHQHLRMSIWGLMVGMSLHALMDGVILVHSEGESTADTHFHSLGLLAGIVVHKIPAAIVLVTVLAYSIKAKKTLITLLLIFSIASPIGLFFGDYVINEKFLSTASLTYIFAIVSGNFLHISTTIYFESSPHHHFNWKKVVYALAGAILAIGIELMH